MGFDNSMEMAQGLVSATGSVMGGRAKARELGHERKLLKVQSDLDVLQANKKRRQATGAEISKQAGSGTGLDLESILRQEQEWDLDIAIKKENTRIQQRSLRASQKQVKRMGYYGAIKPLTKIDSGIEKTKLGEKFSGTKLGAWMQT